MSKPLFVAVLISAGRHPISGAPRACRGDAVAMALGRKLAGNRLAVVHAGDDSAAALQDYLALGAGRIDVLKMPEDQDPIGPLAAHLKDTDLILTGSRAEKGAGSGLLPYRLAHALGRPIAGDVLDVHIENNEAYVRQFLPKGKRRAIAAVLPLVLTVHPLASAVATYAYARRMTGRIDALAATTAPECSDCGAWTIEPTARRAIPLKAPQHKDGHARMLEYVESQAKGGAVVFDGSPVDKAQILLSYLRENCIIDF